MSSLETIFYPHEVVLIGSSRTKEEFGMTSPQLFNNVVHNMKRFFLGKTHVIDTDRTSKSKNTEELLKYAELAVIMLPPRESLEFAEKCAKANAKSFVIITGGFSDVQRTRLLKIREECGVRILGPNTIMGVVNTANGLNLTFERDFMPHEGSIAFISQSGGVGACLLDLASNHNVGVSKFAFVGDKIDIDDADLLRYYGIDDSSKVICMYIEGIKDGKQFIKEARKVTRKKPVIALKGGTTRESAERAKSHTSSIAGSDEIFDAAFKKAGIMRARNTDDLINGAIALSKQPPMLGDRVAVVSNVGGPAILAADAVVRNKLVLSDFSKRTKRSVKRLYPSLDTTNPMDIIADARADRFFQILDLVLSDRNVDGVLVINMLKSCFFEPSDAEAILKVTRKHPRKPVVDVPAGGEDFRKVHAILGKTCIPLYDLPEKAANALKFLREYAEILQKK